MGYQKMFEPISIGRVRSRNRIMRLPTTANLGAGNRVTPELVAHYRSIAGGGCGIIVTEGMAVHPSGLRGARTLAAFEPDCVKGLRRLTDAVHAQGGIVLAQLMHGGRQHHSVRGLPPMVAPSAVACDYSGGVPHALTEEEVEDIIAGFARAAANCIRAGFDGVEIHGAQGYLVQQFLSPASNHRSDAFGGSPENRERFALRIVEAVRNAIGAGPVVGFRLGVDEFLEGGIDVEQSVAIAGDLARTRSIDLFSFSQGTFPTIETHLPDRHFPAGPSGEAHLRVREAVDGLPTVTCGRYADPEDVEQALLSEQGDIVGMSRTLTADPEWPCKVQADEIETIIPCIACNRCWQCSATGEPLKCVVNPRTGRELTPVANDEARYPDDSRIVVVGGGPAGMAAARMAAEHGARVDLYELSETFGGQLAIAARMPNQAELGLLAGRLRGWAEEAGVFFHTGEEVTEEKLESLEPDAVILATGAALELGPSGADGGPKEVAVDQVPELASIEGQRALVVDEDGANASVAVAEALAEKGYEVVVSTFHFEPFRELSAVSRLHALSWLDRRETEFRPNQRIARLDGKDMVMTHKASGRERRLEKLDLIVRVGNVPARDGLSETLRYASIPFRMIGDARSPRRIEDAIREGEEAARDLAALLASPPEAA